MALLAALALPTWSNAAPASQLDAAAPSDQDPIGLSKIPIPENPSWKNRVIGDGADVVNPVQITSTSGAVKNARGLVDPSRGPATLTLTPGEPAPTIVLDYGREVGGLPYFDISGVDPAGDATSVNLRAGYSETYEFMWSYGNTTLSVAAVAGDTNVKVGSVGNFVVGGTLTVSEEEATIAAVGTQSRSTTLFAPAAAGDTNVKVASTTGIGVGETLRIDTAGATESVTITSVGTQGRNTTLAAPAAAGDTNVKVASVTGMSAGDTLHIDTGAARETRTIVTVGTSGAGGTGLTLSSPLTQAHAAGATAQNPGTGISFTPALTANHDAGAGVLSLGTGLTLTEPLTEAHDAGTPVRGVTGALTGDRNGFNGVGVAPSRTDNFSLTEPGTVGNAADQVQGGQRFQAITLTTPGTVELEGVGTRVRYPNYSSEDYAGHFLSSDDKLNRIWYQGVYTNDTNMVPIGALPNQTIPVILDGAKRDRRIWSGDLLVQGRNAFTSQGIGPEGSDYIKGSLHVFGNTQAANGQLFGHVANYTVSPPTGGFYSTPYSIYHVISLGSYYLHTGDLEFIRSQYQVMKNQLAYNQTLVDPAVGLLVTTGGNGRDWDFYDGSKLGAVTATNALYYKALTEAAQLAGELAARNPNDPAASTWQADAQAWANQAAALKERINTTLFDQDRGVYKLADRDNANHPATAVPQDANSNAINFGLAPKAAYDDILGYLRDNLWGEHGPQPYSPDANYSTVISPFVTGMEVEARFRAGDSDGALDLIHLMWDQMINKSGPYYTGTLWEKLNQDGTDVDANASLSHGWASGPVWSLSAYLLGARPVTAGFKEWIIAPQPAGTLPWAQGQVPTPSGPLVSRWRHDSDDDTFKLTMSAPSGTSGTVAVPLLGNDRTIAMDGKVVWQNGSPASGVAAEAHDGAVHFIGITGSHTFAWANGG